MQFSTSDFSQTAIARMVKKRHPYYIGMLKHWQFLKKCYKGGPEWFEGNIFQYMKEGEKEYADRVGRAYRFNHTREVVDLVNKYLFRQKPVRNDKDAPEQLVTFWNHTTINGLGMDEFAKAISTKTSIYGRIYVVVDSTVTENMVSQEDVEKQQGQIYAYILTPDNVLDMSYDNRGVLNWVLVREYVRDDESPINSTGNMVARYRLWTRNQWFVFKAEKSERTQVEQPEINTAIATTSQPILRDTTEILELVASGDHNMGEVPVIPCDNTVTDELYHSESLVGDIAYLDRAVTNYASNLDAIIQDQTFSQLAMPAQGLLPGDDEYEKLLELGTKRIFIYDGESGAAPMFLSPDPRQAQLISAAINQIIGEIYHSVGLGVERSKDVSTNNADKASGVAKSIDFERVAALLTSKADSMEYIENRICRIASKWAGIDVGTDEFVAYPDSFDVRELYDEFYIATQMALIEMPASVRGEQMKTVVEKMFPQMSEDLAKRLKEDVNAWVSQEEEMSEHMHLTEMMNQVSATTTIETGSGLEGAPSDNPEKAADAATSSSESTSTDKDGGSAAPSEPTQQTVVIIKEAPERKDMQEESDGDEGGKYAGKGNDKAKGMPGSKTVFKRQEKTVLTRKVDASANPTNTNTTNSQNNAQSRVQEEALRNREVSGRIQSIAKTKSRNQGNNNEKK